MYVRFGVLPYIMGAYELVAHSRSLGTGDNPDQVVDGGANFINQLEMAKI